MTEGQGRDRAIELVSKPGAAMRQLERHAENDPELRRLHRDAKAVLDDRHILTHSLSMVGELDGQEAFYIWNPRQDTEAQITLEQLNEHARDIRTAVRRVQEVFGKRAAPGG